MTSLRLNAPLRFGQFLHLSKVELSTISQNAKRTVQILNALDQVIHIASLNFDGMGLGGLLSLVRHRQ